MLKDKYINPFTDFGFKKLFGEESSKELLVDFLNQLLPPQHQIQDLQFRQTEQLGSTLADRKAVFDLYCQSPSGERFIVELQKAKQNWFKDRSVFYSTFPIQEQAEKGEWNFRLEPVYCIGILDFVFEEDQHNPQFLHRVAFTEQNSQKVFYDKLWLIYLEMPRFQKTETELETQFDKWLYFLKHLPDFEHIPTPLRSQLFLKAFEVAEIAQFNSEQRQSYERSLKYYRDLKNVVDTSFEEGKAEGWQEGLQEGIQKGKQEGLQEGIQKGKQEGLQEGIQKGKQELARQMKAKGFELAVIAELTGLPLQDIARLTETP
jgi:predicted transposase/invertase (TIGR01784 family)